MRKFNPLKNIWLKRERGATFEDVVTNGKMLAIRENPNYQGQVFEIYYFQSYVWVVVLEKDPERYITMYKSRKLMREFGYV
jgi:hypothetical protein